MKMKMKMKMKLRIGKKVALEDTTGIMMYGIPHYNKIFSTVASKSLHLPFKLEIDENGSRFNSSTF